MRIIRIAKRVGNGSTIMRMSYLTFWTILSFHAVKYDDVYAESILRQIRFTKKEKYAAGFEESLPRKVRVTRGEVAFLTCMVENIVNESVSWIRSRDLHILTVDDDVYTGDKRFRILLDAPTNWTLRIDNVQLEDSGFYECQISTQPVSVFPIYLKVFDRRRPSNSIEHFLDYGMDVEDVTYPDVVNDEKAVELTQYQREDYGSTKILEGGEMSVREGAVLNITCDVYVGRYQSHDFLSTLDENNPIRNLSLVWLHNDQVINEMNCHDGTSIRTKNSSRQIRSRLLIWRVMLNDSGVYRCRPLKVNKEAVIKVEVINGHQLVVRSIGTLITTLISFHIFLHICNHFL